MNRFEILSFDLRPDDETESWEDERRRSTVRRRASSSAKRGRSAKSSKSARGASSSRRASSAAHRKPPGSGQRKGSERTRSSSRRPRRPAAVAPCVCPAHGTEFVRWVQSALNRIDSVGLPVNGLMTAATRQALRAFQQRGGLPVDGIAGPETERALRDAGGRGTGNANSGTSDSGTDTPDDAASTDELAFEFEAPARESASPTLRRGSRGAAVRDLQRRLAAAGHSAGAADGIFGSLTDAAVRSLQRARRLAADGIVGPLTWAALRGTAPTAPTSPGTGGSSATWVLPAAVRAAGDAVTVRYDSPPSWAGSPGNCSPRGTFTAGAAALKSHLLTTHAGISSIGGYSCRPNSNNGSETSVHGTGRAMDIMIPKVGGRADSSVGDAIANWLVSHAADLGVQYVIWNRVRWSGNRTPRVATYTGRPHDDHVHVELNNDGANRRTPWFQVQREAALGASGRDRALRRAPPPRRTNAPRDLSPFGAGWE